MRDNLRIVYLTNLSAVWAVLYYHHSLHLLLLISNRNKRIPAHSNTHSPSCYEQCCLYIVYMRQQYRIYIHHDHLSTLKWTHHDFIGKKMEEKNRLIYANSINYTFKPNLQTIFVVLCARDAQYLIIVLFHSHNEKEQQRQKLCTIRKRAQPVNRTQIFDFCTWLPWCRCTSLQLRYLAFNV